jgi:hypothetical protein
MSKSVVITPGLKIQVFWDGKLCCQELPSSAMLHHRRQWSIRTPHVTSPLLFLMGKILLCFHLACKFAVYFNLCSTVLLYIPLVSYCDVGNHCNLVHCVSAVCCIKVNHFQLFLLVHFSTMSCDTILLYAWRIMLIVIFLFCFIYIQQQWLVEDVSTARFESNLWLKFLNYAFFMLLCACASD